MNDWDEADAFDAAASQSNGQGLAAQAMAARPAPYLDGLNPDQLDAVEALDGPVLVLAGAGTGKTRALTTRIAHLLNTGRARPNEILAVTFTNKAAREMKSRIGSHVGGVIEGMPWLGTFHSLCVKILRRHAELVDLKSNFTILDTDDQIRLLKQLIQAEHIDDKRWPARMLASFIDRWKNRGWTPDKVPGSESAGFNHQGAELYAQYQERLKTLNACDFGDLLLHVVNIFQDHPDVLEKYQNWFRYILVDEYQDTNVAQYLWLRLLAAEHKNICCVGDDDQSIYGWRGAEVGNILKFEKDFPGAKTVRLEQNYRSTPHILAAASGVIAGNATRLGKTLWTEANDGEKVRLIGHWDGEEEARWIGEELEDVQAGRGRYKYRENVRSQTNTQEDERLQKHKANAEAPGVAIGKAGDPKTDFKTRKLESGNADVPPGYSLNEAAILVRASFQMRAFEDRFLTIGLPYRVIGGPRFYERMEIRDAMAYFRVVVSPDDGLAFERIVNTPKRGLGDKAIQTVNATARQHGVSLLEGARIVIADALLAKRALNSLQLVVQNFDRWHDMLRSGEFSHVDLAEIILDESGYTDMWRNDKTPEAPGRLENLKELVKALEEFENLQGFLEHVSLVMDNEQEEATEKVSIMTLHAAKGLEFPVVFLPGWEDGLFPSQRSMDESGLKGVEEERRLAYVGLTRAEEHLTISFAANRRVYNQWNSALPSRFIDELPADHVEVLTPPGLYGGGYGAAAPNVSDLDGIMRGSELTERASKADVYNSPGWKRMQARTGQRGMSQPKDAKNMVIDMQAAPAFELGDRVFHQKFGYGAVTDIEGDKLTVLFDKAGSKNIVSRFITGADDIPF